MFDSILELLGNIFALFVDDIADRKGLRWIKPLSKVIFIIICMFGVYLFVNVWC